MCSTLQLRPTPIEVKFKNMPLERMISILNGSDYQYVGPTVEFHTFRTWFLYPSHDNGPGLNNE